MDHHVGLIAFTLSNKFLGYALQVLLNFSPEETHDFSLKHLTCLLCLLEILYLTQSSSILVVIHTLYNFFFLMALLQAALTTIVLECM